MSTVRDGRFQPHIRDGKHCVDHPFPRSSIDLDSLYFTWLSDVGMVQHQLQRRATIFDLKSVPVRPV